MIRYVRGMFVLFGCFRVVVFFVCFLFCLLVVLFVGFVSVVFALTSVCFKLSRLSLLNKRLVVKRVSGRICGRKATNVL